MSSVQDGDKVGSWETRSREIKEGAVLILCAVYDLKHIWSKLRECKKLPDCEFAVSLLLRKPSAFISTFFFNNKCGK